MTWPCWLAREPAVELYMAALRKKIEVAGKDNAFWRTYCGLFTVPEAKVQ